MRSTINAVPSSNRTVIGALAATTCRLVAITPARSITKPVPTLSVPASMRTIAGLEFSTICLGVSGAGAAGAGVPLPPQPTVVTTQAARTRRALT